MGRYRLPARSDRGQVQGTGSEGTANRGQGKQEHVCIFMQQLSINAYQVCGGKTDAVGAPRNQGGGPKTSKRRRAGRRTQGHKLCLA